MEKLTKIICVVLTLIILSAVVSCGKDEFTLVTCGASYVELPGDCVVGIREIIKEYDDCSQESDHLEVELSGWSGQNAEVLITGGWESVLPGKNVSVPSETKMLYIKPEGSNDVYRLHISDADLKWKHELAWNKFISEDEETEINDDAVPDTIAVLPGGTIDTQ